MIPVSVIIPCHNSESTIARCIESVLGQTAVPEELIIVDDASTDGTLNVIETARKHHLGTLVVVRHTRNCGPSVARNAGWRAATQPYVAFLDSDDTWHPKKLELQYGWMQSHPEVSLTAHPMTQIHSECESLDPPPIWRERTVSRSAMLARKFIFTPSVMVRRQIPFRFAEDMRHCEDYFLWLQIVFSGHRACFLDIPLAFMYKHPYNTNGLGSNLLAMELGELSGLKRLWRSQMIGTPTFLGMCIYSVSKCSIRYLRRVARISTGIRSYSRA